jgi:iron complex outermembrane receptor protein
MAQTTLERVEIVGSNIKRVAKEGAVPVVIITKEDIAKTGATTVQELVKNLGISGGQQINTGASGSFVTGASAAGFRGLPATDTLVLLNGRRIAPYGRSEQTSSGGAVAFVDLNSLPLSAVEQVQILKDGASAIYGADAVAGVLNVITKKDYTGAEVNVSYGQYGDPGGQDAKVNATLGFGNFDEKGYNGMVMLEKSSVKEIWNKDRDFTKTYDYRGVRPYLGDYRSSYTPYGNYGVDSGAIDYGAGDNCPAGNLRGGFCRYDFGNVEQVQPATDRMSAMFVGNLKLTNNIKAFSEFAYNQNVTKSASRAPALGTDVDFTQVDAKRGLALGTTANLVRASLADQYNALATDPLGLIAGSGVEGGLTTLDIRTRFTEYGPRTDEITTDSLRYVLGLKGTLANSWDWETAYMVSEQTVKNIAANEINKELLADLLVAGSVTNLFTDSTNKGGYASARYIGSEETTSKLSIFDFKMSGELTKLPAGPLGIAFGGESRKEKMDSVVDPVTAAGLKTGSASVETSGSRDVNAFFGELSIPIASMVEAQVAVRTERYSDFGTSTNPKVAVRFQPTNELMFRASSGKAFKAPTLFQLYEGQAAGGYEELTDSVRCDAGVTAECDATRLIEVRSGGVIPQGLTLNPEKSTNTNLGVVWSPSSNFNLALDYWQISKKDAIIKADAQTLIDTNSAAVVRNLPVGGVPGSIVRVTSTYFNANQQELKGIDLDVNAKTKLAGGTLGGGASITYNLQFDQVENGVTIDLLDQYYYFIVPRYRAQYRVSYDIGKWTTAAFLNITPGYQNQVSRGPGALAAQTEADGYKTVDLFASYSGFKSLVLSGGVRNLFNQSPTYLAGAGPATDPSLYDMRGRFFYFNANYKF